MSGYIGSKSSVTQVDGYNRAEADAEFVNDPNSVITVDGSNNVGIGTTSPSADLEIASGNPTVQLTDTDDSGYSRIRHNTGSLIFEADKGNTTASSAIRFDIDNFEAMRIDSSGNLLVGKTSDDATVSGMALRGNGVGVFTRASSEALYANRLTTDGEIIKFAKNTTTVGSIGANSGRIYVSGPSSGISFGGTTSAILPTNSSGTLTDNAYDVGSLNTRFDDIYATNGTIQTSDRNEKQDIEALSDAEQRVAVACKGLLRKFRWIDAVAEKGDDARIHFGIIAQDLQDVFAAEGLDAGRYAMFISSTWWEHEGTTYDTLEEAPEGATERTRLGVRYPELLAFIIGAM